MTLQVSAMELQRPVPVDAGLDAGDPMAPFALLAEGRAQGRRGALITIVGLEGGAPRPLGTQMAVLEDGRYCGYVSGGCVEAAVAAEALVVLERGRDATLRFGLGSPFVDIQLPCGGGIDMHVHIDPDASTVARVQELTARRAAFSLVLPADGVARVVQGDAPGRVSEWVSGAFHRRFAPRTRLMLIGRGLEFRTLARVGRAAGLDVVACSPDAGDLAAARQAGIEAVGLAALEHVPVLPADPWTAMVFLFHDHDWETALLRAALDSEAFFIGALGSRRTHAVRCERLARSGVSEAQIARICGPVGLFGPARSANALAVSVLAQIAEHRTRLDGS